jgi:hypothetical protein
MDDDKIITAYCIIDDVLKKLGHRSHTLAQVDDAEVLTVAVVAAMYFQNHHARALEIMYKARYITKPLSASRFNRRLHALGEWLEYILELMGDLYSSGEAFVLDSIPVPVCKYVRSNRCRKVQGPQYCGYCSSKKERYYGWKLHLLCTPHGVPVAYSMLPASYHDLTPVHELTACLQEGAWVYADKAYNSAPDEASILCEVGVKLVPQKKG